MWLIKEKEGKAIDISKLKQIRKVDRKLKETGCVLLFFFDSMDVPTFQVSLETSLKIGVYLGRIKMLEQDHNMLSYEDFIEEMNRTPGGL